MSYCICQIDTKSFVPQEQWYNKLEKQHSSPYSWVQPRYTHIAKVTTHEWNDYTTHCWQTVEETESETTNSCWIGFGHVGVEERNGWDQAEINKNHEYMYRNFSLHKRKKQEGNNAQEIEESKGVESAYSRPLNDDGH